ncbi:hypothetical protein scyTo_0004808 [Scyliorhinus torazame]|uniref:Chemokine interleukin-8-like domain-containing protein n=1 Tax=Scyliorhinus torazame TaxID=75743 RepID=A0A401NXB2_SCYTO|nr:hypothetical protein [Scyliorhinus torazame]
MVPAGLCTTCAAARPIQPIKRACANPAEDFRLRLCRGIPIPGTQGRCRCPQTSSIPINPRYIKSLKYIPKGSHCETLEIIVTMKNRSMICVNPNANWVKIIIKATKGWYLMFVKIQTLCE